MSTFTDLIRPCAHCGAPERRRIAVSLNAGRSPQHRQAILDRTFQSFACAACGKQTVIEDDFMYTDFDRKHWIGVFHSQHEAHWRALESHAVDAFDQNMTGPAASQIARDLARGFTLRTVFGIGALREKLLCFDHGIEDAVLEVLKLSLMREGLVDFSPSGRPRLVEVAPETLTLELRRQGSKGWQVATLPVPRAALDEIGARLVEHAPILRQLQAGSYVDLGRVLLSG